MALRRIFKFRGKKLSDGEPTDVWVYGSISLEYGGINEESLFKRSNDPDLYSKGLRSAEIYDPRTHSTYAILAETLGQWTGFRDSKGNEIYEDDIVNDGKSIGVVTWFPNRACFQLKCKSTNVYLHDKKGVVLGNTIDNPDLTNQIQ